MKCQSVNLYREQYDVYIGRAGKGKDGYFGNPVVLNQKCPVCDEVHTTRGDTLPCFKIYFLDRFHSDEDFSERVKQLNGKKLGCFCKPQPCHGDVIAELVNGLG